MTIQNHLLLPRMGYVTRFFLLLVWVSTAIAQTTIQFSTVSQDIVEKRLGAYVSKNDQREPAVRHIFEDAGCAVRLPVSGMNVDQVGTTDSEPFREKKIPAITIHSLTSATLPILHSPKDRIAAVRKDEYFRTYQLVLAYLAVLDQKLD
jgi:hypothetical protein